jgi:hypothetical protein
MSPVPIPVKDRNQSVEWILRTATRFDPGAAPPDLESHALRRPGVPRRPAYWALTYCVAAVMAVIVTAHRVAERVPQPSRRSSPAVARIASRPVRSPAPSSTRLARRYPERADVAQVNAPRHRPIRPRNARRSRTRAPRELARALARAAWDHVTVRRSETCLLAAGWFLTRDETDEDIVASPALLELPVATSVQVVSTPQLEHGE